MKIRSALFSAVVAVFIFWRFQHDCKDVLEVQTTLGGTWSVVPGPYKLVPNGDGSWDYVVELPTTEPSQFYRVRREWGNPDVGPELPDWNDKTYKP